MTRPDPLLLDAFVVAAQERGLFGEKKVTAPDLFRLVRDMPYRRPSDGRPGTLVEEWCGTCSGKHVLLQQLLYEIGVSSRLMIATYRYSWQAAGAPPPELAAILDAGPVPDVHNFLEVQGDAGWLPVDATWPETTKELGFAFNQELVPGVAHQIACVPPYHAWPVPAGVQLPAYKERIVRGHCGPDLRRREAFIEAIAAWISARLG